MLKLVLCVINAHGLDNTYHLLFKSPTDEFNFFFIFYRDSFKDIPWIFTFFQKLSLKFSLHKKVADSIKMYISFCYILLFIYFLNEYNTFSFCLSTHDTSTSNNDSQPNNKLNVSINMVKVVQDVFQIKKK